MYSTIQKQPSFTHRLPYQYQQSNSDTTSSEEDQEETYEDEEYAEEEDHYCNSPGPYQDDLTYQNNEDYLDLVQELQETLHNRSRNRVHRAMKEFEHRSKYNKPLERPIINYDETSESEEPIIQKIYFLTDKKKKNICTPCVKPPKEEPCRRFRRKSKSPRRRSKSPNYLRRNTRRDKTHWQMNQDTGEWYKLDGKHRSRKSRTPSPQTGFNRYDCTCGKHSYR